MKIVRIVPSLDFGGLEQRVYLTLLGFREKSDFSIQLIVLGNGGYTAERLNDNGESPLLMGYSYKIPNLLLIFKLTLLLRKCQPDVVHASSAEGNFHGLIAAKLAGVPVRIGEEIGYPNHRFLARFIFKIIYSLATHVIAISNSVKDKIVELGEAKKSQILVVYNPVTLSSDSNVMQSPLFISAAEKFNLFPKTENFTFVTVCRLVPIKNLHSLINCFAKLNKRDVTLWIVGEGPERESLEKLTIALGISANVIFFGFQNNIALWLNNADAFVLPSYSEGFSISLVEAMLCGLPCIATKIGGPAELIQNKISGFLIDPLDSHELFMVMEKLTLMPEMERSFMGKKAKKFAKKFSVQNYVNHLSDVYRQS